jgi:hypothetical protein
MDKLTEEFGPDADEDLPEEVLAAIEDGLTPLEASGCGSGSASSS